MTRHIIFLLGVMATSCEPVPHAQLKGGNPPVFAVGQGATLSRFYVCCERELEPHEEENYLWEIERDWDKKSDVDRFDIVYGISTEVFRQTVPENKKSPTALIERRKYYYDAIGSMGSSGGCFEIRDNNAVSIKCDNSNVEIKVELKEGEELPTFTLRGNDYLFDVVVAYEDRSAPDMGDWTLEYAWQARPDDQHKKQLPIEITYGILPEGYKQFEPANGNKPVKLKSGVTYQFRAKGVWNKDRVCFEIRDHKVVKAECDMGWAG